MRRAPIAIVLALGAALTACTEKKRIAECDALLSTIERVNNCPTATAEQRKDLVDSAQRIRASMKMLEDSGGPSKAPPDLINSMRDACKTQETTLRTVFADCLK